jgi:hypothetical protein
VLEKKSERKKKNTGQSFSISFKILSEYIYIVIIPQMLKEEQAAASQQVMRHLSGDEKEELKILRC